MLITPRLSAALVSEMKSAYGTGVLGAGECGQTQCFYGVKSGESRVVNWV